MKLKIWEDREGVRHTSLDDKEISDILMSLTLSNRPKKPSQVELVIAPSCIEVVAQAEISIVMGGNEYHFKP